jgi:5-methylcytosine-specific restriction protein A
MPTSPPNHKPQKAGKVHEARPNFRQRGYNYRWDKLRGYFLHKNPLCKACMEQGKLTPATEVDHVIPHRGDQKLFWNEANWAAMCKPCHSRKTAEEVNARK